MKKAISISLIILTLAAMVQVTVATHYCGGEIAGTKISFSGEIASCGMEDGETSLPCQDIYLTTHCCENVIHNYSITSNYFPSFSGSPLTYQPPSPYYIIPGVPALSSSSSLRTYSDKSPPGDISYSSVDLSEICILRI